MLALRLWPFIEVNGFNKVITMRTILFLLFRFLRYIYRRISFGWSILYTRFIFYLFNVKYGDHFKTKGIPIIDITSGCTISIGKNFKMNNGSIANRIGRQQRCFFVLDHNSKLTIGNNVGLSSTAIICHHQITIGNNVRTGGNTVIYDTDFHSLNAEHRQQFKEDATQVSRKSVCIGDDVFIGAHTTILKGVTIGNNAIIGACSLITRDIPQNQVWGGNPAKYIRDI